MEIECPAFSKCESELDGGVYSWYAAAGDWLYGRGPVIRPEEGGADVCVLEIEDGRGEGLELGARRRG